MRKVDELLFCALGVAANAKAWSEAPCWAIIIARQGLFYEVLILLGVDPVFICLSLLNQFQHATVCTPIFDLKEFSRTDLYRGPFLAAYGSSYRLPLTSLHIH